MPDDPLEGRTRVLHRELIGITLLIAAAILGFVATRAIAAASQRMRLVDANRWYQLAQQRTAANQPDRAVRALRRASGLDRDNAVYRLALAQALAGDGQGDAAHQVLDRLRQLAPDDPDIDVPLARLEARRQNASAAIQYYENALHGQWPPERDGERRRLRVELIEYLLQHGERGRAQSELLILSANVPDDLTSHREIGQLLLAAGDPQRATDHFIRALRIAPCDAQSLAGAGEAAIAAGDYEHARAYLSGAELPAPLKALRALADAVVASDPLRAHLRLDDRRIRLMAGLDYAKHRLDACSTDFGPLRSEVEAFARGLSPRAVHDEPELVDGGVRLIARVQAAAAGRCGADNHAIARAWAAIIARLADETS